MTGSAYSNQQDAVAIIGIGCRLPSGLNDPEAFWKFLCDARVAAGDVPADRWNPRTFYDPDPDKPGTMNMRRASFLLHVDQMDAEFFGISPREAASIDPQHRLLLETTWEAFEDAGQVAERLAGSATGVFIGISRSDYEGITQHDVDLIHAHTNSGTALSIAANRISYVFDFRGPSLALDTACASGLTALHLACQSLGARECSLAVAGGVNVLLRPHMSVGFTKAHMLAADGRCKTFDVHGDGFGRAEGAAVVLLKRLSDARADGDPIYAIVRATGINTDGRKNGIMMPSVGGQASLLRDVYTRAGIPPDRVGYVEAHGTGTPVGDPIEVEALGQVLGLDRRPGNVCLIGSAKANVGHLSSAAGIVGLIKAALCLRYRLVPPQPLLEHLNPNIPFDRAPFRVPLVVEPFPAGSEPAIAGVSAFGFGGANAHAVLEEAPPAASAGIRTDDPTAGEPGRSAPAASMPHLVPLSARSPEALRAFAEACRELMSTLPAGAGLHDLAYSLGARRSHHDYRLAITAHSCDEARDILGAFLAGEEHAGLSADRRTPGEPAKLAFVCSGMGPQWWGMGRQLLVQEPVFADTVARCDAIFQREAGWSLMEELKSDEAHSRIDQISVAQPATFVIQVALAALWRSWGLEPEAVVGHSIGEVAAAHIAGALSLENAVRVVCHRSRLQQRTTGMGSMLAVGLSPEDAAQEAAAWDGRVSVAAVNSPHAATLSGETAALERIAASLDAKGVFCRMLRVPNPAHSHYLDPLRGELEDALQDIKPQLAALPLFSTVTGQRAAGGELETAYWWRNMREPVRFAAAIRSMIDEGYRTFVEVGPHPVLTGSIAECLAAAGQDGVALPSLRRHDEEKAVMWRTLGVLYSRGYPVQWDRLYRSGRFVRFPRYPWQRRRFWHESAASRRERMGENDHPLLGRRQDSALLSWETKVDPRRVPLAADHRVQGTALFPGAGYVEMGFAAARAMFEAGPQVLEAMEIRQPMAFPEGNAARVVQSIYTPADGTLKIYSRSAEDPPAWILHAELRLVPPPTRRADIPPSVPLETIRSRCAREIPVDAFLAEKERVGQTLGPRFQALRRIWVGQEEALAHIELPEPVQAEQQEYLLHPGVFDACLQLVPAIDMGEPGCRMDGLHLITRVGRARLYRRPGSSLWAHARIVKREARSRTTDFVLCDDAGNVVLEVEGEERRYLEGTARRDEHAQWLYESRWHIEPRAGEPEHRPADGLPAPTELTNRVAACAASPSSGPGDERAPFDPRLDRLAAAYVLRAFAQLGWPDRVGERVSLANAAAALHVPPQREHLLADCLGTLEGHGVLDRQDDGEWIVRRLPTGPDAAGLEAEWRTLLREWPAGYAELQLVRRAGDGLLRVLRDETDILQILCPDGDLSTAEWYFQDSPTHRRSNELIQQILRAAVDSLPPWRSLRILEIGAGPGGTAAYALSALSESGAHYVLTDPSASLLAHAEQRFADYPFVERRVLDIEQDPVRQGFLPHTFDVVLVSGFRGAAGGLGPAWRHVRRLLASRGLVIIAEPLLGRARRSSNITFGGFPGYWPFVEAGGADALRPSLEQAGFADVRALPGRDSAGTAPAVIVARGPRVAEPEPSATTAAPAELPAEARNWLIFADRRNVGARVAQRLRERGARCVLVNYGDAFLQAATDQFELRPGRADDFRRLLEALPAEQHAGGQILHLWSLDIPATDALAPEILAEQQRLGVLSVLHLIHALDAARWTPRLWLTTGGAQLESQAVAQAPLWGLGRVIQNEHPELRCTLVDVGGGAGEADVQALSVELVSGSAEREVALRGPARWVQRLHRGSPAPSRSPRPMPADGQPAFRATVPSPGALESLGFEPAPRRAPQAGEVEIEVFAAALNFKDLLTALAVIPAEQVLLGLECAGRISAVGDGVEGLRVGDDVIALAPGCLGAFVTAPAPLVLRKPGALSFAAAATLPVAFLTASYGLEHLGRLARGERVLIHAATGGVGLAALQIARSRGAEVFATAGSPEKREFLRLLGVEHVMDSRSVDFADDVMRRTNGEGVDVILNSLAGDALGRGLGALRPGGRFIDISKTDILADRTLGLRVFEKNLTYAALDLARVRTERPALAGALFRDVLARVESGMIGPLPYRVFPVGRLGEALRHFAKTRHIGKIVIDVKAGPVPVMRVPAATLLDADGTYLITGGLGGFGMATARWMAAHGARHLALIGRRGAASDAARVAVEQLRAAGVCVSVLKGDVTRADDVARALAEIKCSLPPLRGVVHAAMVLDDGALLRLDEERFMKALAPKMLGAWNLHRLTAHEPLDLCLFFSSAAVVHGNPGQGNYAAGNAFLDALAWHRRTAGLPATAINWGAISDVGYLAEHEAVGRSVGRSGAGFFTASDALRALEAVLPGAPVQIGIFRQDWTQFVRTQPVGKSPRFAEFADEAGTPPANAEEIASETSIGVQVAAAPPRRRRAVIESHLRLRTAKIMGLSAAKLDAVQPLIRLGLDSLMAIELRTWIQAELGGDVPITTLLGGASLSQLSTQLAGQAGTSNGEMPAAGPGVEQEEIRV